MINKCSIIPSFNYTSILRILGCDNTTVNESAHAPPPTTKKHPPSNTYSLSNYLSSYTQPSAVVSNDNNDNGGRFFRPIAPAKPSAMITTMNVQPELTKEQLRSLKQSPHLKLPKNYPTSREDTSPTEVLTSSHSDDSLFDPIIISVEERPDIDKLALSTYKLVVEFRQVQSICIDDGELFPSIK